MLCGFAARNEVSCQPDHALNRSCQRLFKALGMADIDESALPKRPVRCFRSGLPVVARSSPASTTEQGLPQHASALLSGIVSEVNTAWFPPTRWAGPWQVEPAPEDPSLPLETPETAGGTSLIRDQAACPFRAFARHRLNLLSLQPTVIGISASERGAFLHEALFRLWRQIESSDALTSLSSEAEQNLIEEAVAGAMQQTESACEARVSAARAGGFSLLAIRAAAVR